MKKQNILKLGIASAAMILWTGNAADLKIGVIDMGKALQEFHKFKTASELLKENVAKAEAEVKEKEAAFKAMVGELEKAKKAAEDPILSADSRNKKTAEFNLKLNEIRKEEQILGELRQRRAKQIDQEIMQVRRSTLEEVIAVVKEKAKVETYDLVMDKSALSYGGAPNLLYSKDSFDFTDSVIAILNKDAPKSAEVTPAGTEPAKK